MDRHGCRDCYPGRQQGSEGAGGASAKVGLSLLKWGGTVSTRRFELQVLHLNGDLGQVDFLFWPQQS